MAGARNGGRAGAGFANEQGAGGIGLRHGAGGKVQRAGAACHPTHGNITGEGGGAAADIQCAGAVTANPKVAAVRHVQRAAMQVVNTNSRGRGGAAAADDQGAVAGVERGHRAIGVVDGAVRAGTGGVGRADKQGIGRETGRTGEVHNAYAAASIADIEITARAQAGAVFERQGGGAVCAHVKIGDGVADD